MYEVFRSNKFNNFCIVYKDLNGNTARYSSAHKNISKAFKAQRNLTTIDEIVAEIDLEMDYESLGEYVDEDHFKNDSPEFYI